MTAEVLKSNKAENNYWSIVEFSVSIDQPNQHAEHSFQRKVQLWYRFKNWKCTKTYLFAWGEKHVRGLGRLVARYSERELAGKLQVS